MQDNKFELQMFDGVSICFSYKSVVVCNKHIKEQLLNGNVDIIAPQPYIIMTNDKMTDDEIEILEDASVGDCISYIQATPVFGGIIV